MKKGGEWNLVTSERFKKFRCNKDENVHRFAERERERKKKIEKERDRERKIVISVDFIKLTS